MTISQLGNNGMLGEARENTENRVLQLPQTQNFILKLRGREFNSSDIRLIENLTKEYFEYGRTVISKKICESLNWVQPNGWLKDRACRDVLRTLDSRKIIVLPKSKKSEKIHPPKNKNNSEGRLKNTPFFREPVDIVDFNQINLVMVKGSRHETVWNNIVNEFHYLGFSHFVGRSIKYIVYYKSFIVGAIGFCDPAWSITCRDNFVGEKFKLTKNEIRLYGVNNGRFLILPWIKIPNLASYVLSKSIKAVKRDWLNYYCIKPIFVETFVDSTKFKGTCYKAANWKKIGITKGYKKKGYSFSNSQVPKHVWIYGLK